MFLASATYFPKNQKFVMINKNNSIFLVPVNRKSVCQIKVARYEQKASFFRHLITSRLISFLK